MNKMTYEGLTLGSQLRVRQWPRNPMCLGSSFLLLKITVSRVLDKEYLRLFLPKYVQDLG